MEGNGNEYSRRKFIKTGLSGLLTSTVAIPAIFSTENEKEDFSSEHQPLTYSGSTENDLFILLKSNNVIINRVETPQEAIDRAPKNTGVIISASDYPSSKVNLTSSLYKKAIHKGIRLFIEYPNITPGNKKTNKPLKNELKRGVITSDFFGEQLPKMSLLGLHECFYLPSQMSNPLISFAKVAGFDKAKYGLTDTKVYPLLYKENNIMVSMTSLTNFKTARFRPSDSWRIIWTHILRWLIKSSHFQLCSWDSDPHPTYGKYTNLPTDARYKSIMRGAKWIFNGHFLIHPSWKDMQLKYQGNGTHPTGPPISDTKLIGDGSSGILEGQASKINYDGSQEYRYWIRCDVHGESSFLLASAGDYLRNNKLKSIAENFEHTFKTVSENLIDYVFYTSGFRQGPRNDKNSPVFGLLSWGDHQTDVFYADDNARCVLGMIGASAFLKKQRWNKHIVENILANFRLSSKQGFFGGRLEQKQIQEKGWKYFHNRDLIYRDPHYESWMWACYIWLYDKTGYKPLLDKTLTAISITMDGYPNKWHWENGIQQERARMILPLAWLVQIEDNPKYQKWLETMVDDLLKYQESCGAIREELGIRGNGDAEATKSNQNYGSSEAALIAENGDPVSDMLYTCNFALFTLNEAARATNNKSYFEAVNKLSDFLTRIQIESKTHDDLNAAWFRGFDYKKWDYWASNADKGWGAWATETGWIQSWIVATQVLLEDDISYWDLTKKTNIDNYMDQAVKQMLK